MGEERPCATPFAEAGESPAPGLFCRRGLTKEEAEDLLDWLEANGYRRFELDGAEGGGFEVRWQARPARN
jgi:hypothetical protein